MAVWAVLALGAAWVGLGEAWVRSTVGAVVDPQAPGAWLVFVGLYAGAMCLMLPSSIMTALAAVLFGPTWGFVYAWLGGMLGASGAFWIGRVLGRNSVRRVGGRALACLDGVVKRHGFVSVFLLRLSGAPLTHVSFGMGLTGAGFGGYLAATGLGNAAGTLAFTHAVGTSWHAAGGGAPLSWTGYLGLAAALAALAVLPLLGRRMLAVAR
ncbi:MAG: VTT domain-containing protein [Deferrisomatales bacterium]|nr:VTT domain-containing protein [Deferrisomatales bacterium]